MNKTRNKLDAYYTNANLTKALIENTVDLIQQDDSIIECCAGTCAISNWLLQNSFRHVEAWDIDRSLKNIEKFGDSSKIGTWQENLGNSKVDWVITNPPYTQPECQSIIVNSLTYAEKGIAMLLRLTYDEPCDNRAEFLKNTKMSHQLIFNPRPQFRTDTTGTDSVTSAWFVWLTDEYAKKVNITGTQKIYVTDWNTT